MSLGTLDVNVLEYMTKRSIILKLEVKLRLRVRDKLRKLEGFRVTKNMRREMTELGNLVVGSQYGSVSSTDDESPDQANQAVAVLDVLLRRTLTGICSMCR